MIKSKSCPDLNGRPGGFCVANVVNVVASPRHSGIGRMSSMSPAPCIAATVASTVVATSLDMSMLPRMVDDIEFYSTSQVTWLSAMTCQPTHRVASAPSLTTSASVSVVEANAYGIATCLASPMEGPETIVREQQDKMQMNKSAVSTTYTSLNRWSEWVRRLRRRKMKEFFAMIGYDATDMGANMFASENE